MTKTTLLSPIHVVCLITRFILHVHGTAYDAFKQLRGHAKDLTCIYLTFMLCTEQHLWCHMAKKLLRVSKIHF